MALTIPSRDDEDRSLRARRDCRLRQSPSGCRLDFGRFRPLVNVLQRFLDLVDDGDNLRSDRLLVSAAQILVHGL